MIPARIAYQYKHAEIDCILTRVYTAMAVNCYTAMNFNCNDAMGFYD